MPRLIVIAAVLGLLVIGSILISGCTGEKAPPQPPASTLTIPTTRPVTPVPATTPPVQITTPYIPPTPMVTPGWTPGRIDQEGAAIQIQGDVSGYKSPQANYISEIRFTVELARGAEDVTFEIPNTQIIFTKTGTPQYGVNYVILSGDENGNRILEDGETFIVSIFFTSDSSQYAIYSGQKFTMAIKNPPQPQVLVTASAPPVLTSEPMVLAAA